MHRELIGIFGIENEEVDLVFLDQALVFAKMGTHLHDLFDAMGGGMLLKCFSAGLDIIVGFFEELFFDGGAGDLGVERGDLADDIEVALEGLLIFDVREKKGSFLRRDRKGEVDEAIIPCKVIGHGHDVAECGELCKGLLFFGVGEDKHRGLCGLCENVEIFAKAVGPTPSLAFEVAVGADQIGLFGLERVEKSAKIGELFARERTPCCRSIGALKKRA